MNIAVLDTAISMVQEQVNAAVGSVSTYEAMMAESERTIEQLKIQRDNAQNQVIARQDTLQGLYTLRKDLEETL